MKITFTNRFGRDIKSEERKTYNELMKICCSGATGFRIEGEEEIEVTEQENQDASN
jgi:hypothetical protein